MKIYLCIVFVAAMLISACSKETSTVIPTAPSKWSSLADHTKNLEQEDKRLLAAYLMRATLRQTLGHDVGVPPGTTIADAIDDEKQFEAKQKIADAQTEALKAQVTAQRNSAIARMNRIITFAMVSTKVIPKDIEAGRFDENLRIVFAVKNNTNKNIAGVKGVVVFDDMFGTNIIRSELSLDNAISAGSTQTFDTYSLKINPFIDADTKLASTPLEKMHVRFEPEMIVYADGSSDKALISDGQ